MILIRDEFVTETTKEMMKLKGMRLDLEPSTIDLVNDEVFFTQQVVCRYLRERWDLNVNAYPELTGWEVNIYKFTIVDCIYHTNAAEQHFESYEQALEHGIQIALNEIPDPFKRLPDANG